MAEAKVASVRGGPDRRGRACSACPIIFLGRKGGRPYPDAGIGTPGSRSRAPRLVHRQRSGPVSTACARTTQRRRRCPRRTRARGGASGRPQAHRLTESPGEDLVAESVNRRRLSQMALTAIRRLLRESVLEFPLHDAPDRWPARGRARAGGGAAPKVSGSFRNDGACPSSAPAISGRFAQRAPCEAMKSKGRERR